MTTASWLHLAAFTAIAVWAIVVFNRLIRGRNMVREAWSGIAVQLKRRSDLVPNLVETVKSYAAHERTLFEEITKKRAASIAAASVTQKSATEAELQSSLSRLLAVAEAYPQLKASDNFLALQHQLAEIEDSLQMARRYYNGTVRDFNISVTQMPNGLVAPRLGFTEQPFFQADAASASAPVVKLDA